MQRLMLTLSSALVALLIVACGGIKLPNNSGGEVKGPDLTTRQPEKKAANLTKPVPDLSKVGVKAGDLTITLLSCGVQKIEVHSFGRNLSEKEHFRVAVQIKNNHKTRKVDFEGWGTEGPFLADSARMTDEHGNTYKRITFGFAAKIEGQIRAASIYPGQSITDVLVFEAPVEAAKKLKLSLPATNFKGEGTIEALVPRDFRK